MTTEWGGLPGVYFTDLIGDAEFDHLSFTYLLRYVDDPAATMRELARVVKPGGHVAMVEFGLPRIKGHPEVEIPFFLAERGQGWLDGDQLAGGRSVGAQLALPRPDGQVAAGAGEQRGELVGSGFIQINAFRHGGINANLLGIAGGAGGAAGAGRGTNNVRTSRTERSADRMREDDIMIA